jgi:excisionase family DNA binding protein
VKFIISGLKKDAAMEEKLYTVGETAKILKVTPYTIRVWLHEGNLGGIRAGRYWRIRERDLKAFYETGTVQKVEKKGS